jgi:C_GCAxxG_C_C family probable redox protein
MGSILFKERRMELNHKNHFNRRDFMLSASGILAAACFGNRAGLYTPFIQKKELALDLSDEESKIVEKSSMAKELMEYFGKGYSCAESILMVSLKHLELSEDLVWAACGFGGGMGKRDLCGLLTGGIMSLGLASGTIQEEKSEAKRLCGVAVDKYWKWWQSQAPLKCRDIRPPGTSSKVCVRLGKLATAEAELLIEEMRGQ